MADLYFSVHQLVSCALHGRAAMDPEPGRPMTHFPRPAGRFPLGLTGINLAVDPIALP